MSLRTKILLALGLCVFASVLGLTWALSRVFALDQAAAVFDSQSRQALATAKEIDARLALIRGQPGIADAERARLEAELLASRSLADLLQATHGAEARIVGHADEPPWVAGRESRTGVVMARELADRKGQRWLVSSVRLVSSAADALVLATPARLVDEAVGKVYRRGAAVGTLALACSLAIGFALARTIASPLADLAARAKEIARGRFEGEVRVPRGRRDEVARLGRAFNQMTRELAETRDNLFRAERLAAIGEFGAVVAHEIKNPLAGILGNAQAALALVRSSGASDGDLIIALEHVQSEARRANARITALLRFARQDRFEPETVDVAALVREASDSVRSAASGANVELRVTVDAKGSQAIEASVDRVRIREALVNILHNAVRAAQGSAGARVDVVCSVQGEEIKISIGDSGPGVPAGLERRIFEPFFTTQRPGEGTGLGLAIAHSALVRHGGRIALGRSPLGGARFDLLLPR